MMESTPLLRDLLDLKLSETVTCFIQYTFPLNQRGDIFATAYLTVNALYTHQYRYSFKCNLD